MIKLTWDETQRIADLDHADGNITDDNGLETAVILSLYSERGFWGDTYPETEGDLIGSELYLCARENITEATLRQVEERAKTALQWMIDDGVATSIDVQAERFRDDGVKFIVNILKPDNLTFTWSTVWGDYTNGL